jgi:hypothetical protein
MKHLSRAVRFSILIAASGAGCGLDQRDLSVAVQGNGTGGPRAVTANASLGSADAGAAMGVPVQTAPATGSSGDATLALSPVRWDFGAVAVGQTSQTDFTLRNVSDAVQKPTAPIIAGDTSASFGVAGSSCADSLAAGATCSLTLKFSPGKTGDFAATLAISGAPPAELRGAGLVPGSPTLSVAPGSSADFGPVAIGSTAEQVFSLQNPTDTDISVTDGIAAGSGEFSLATPGPGDCAAGTQLLRAHASCSIRVQYAPQNASAASATLSVSFSGGGPATLVVSGTGLGPSALVSSLSALDFGGIEVNTTAGTQPWSITNNGGSATGTLSISNSNPQEFSLQGSCPSLDAGQSCNLNVGFSPQQGGTRSATFTLANGSGQGVSLFASGRGQFRVTVAKDGLGVVSAAGPAPIDCGATCTTLVDAGAQLALTALPPNGSNTNFAGWSDTRCPGPLTTCNLTVTASLSITARFRSVSNNIVFLSSALLPSTLGGATAYDQTCNGLATSAGINNSTGDGFLAMVSDGSSSFLTRLGAARGWVRADGAPVIDRFQDLISQQLIYHPVRFDEHGADLFANASPPNIIWTGIDLGGAASSENCSNWTSADPNSRVRVGNLDGASYLWTGGELTCGGAAHVVCFGKVQVAPLSLTAAAGKRIWVSSTNYLPGTMTPDAKCQSERPTGVAQAKALIAYTGSSAASLLSGATNYVRLDGQLVGTGAQIAAVGPDAYIELNAAGMPQDAATWTGSPSITAPGTADSTCNDWTSGVGTAPNGLSESAFEFWSFFPSPCNSPNVNLFCFEQ